MVILDLGGVGRSINTRIASLINVLFPKHNANKSIRQAAYDSLRTDEFSHSNQIKGPLREGEYEGDSGMIRGPLREGEYEGDSEMIRGPFGEYEGDSQMVR